jgi:hypothetical protein
VAAAGVPVCVLQPDDCAPLRAVGQSNGGGSNVAAAAVPVCVLQPDECAPLRAVGQSNGGGSNVTTD